MKFIETHDFESKPVLINLENILYIDKMKNGNACINFVGGEFLRTIISYDVFIEQIRHATEKK